MFWVSQGNKVMKESNKSKFYMLKPLQNFNFVNLVLNVLDALIKLFTLKETQDILLISFV